jgi:hypothetical protein
VSWADVKKKNPVWNGLWRLLRSPASYLVWRDGAMTSPPSPLALLDAHLAQLSRTAVGAAALERFRRAGIETAEAADLCALVRQWDGQGGGSRRAEMLEGLIDLAPEDDIAALCAVVALRPELSRMARHLARGELDPEEAQSEAIAIGWGVVVTRPERSEQGPRRVGSVVNAIWNEARRTAGLRRRGVAEVRPSGAGFDVAAAEDDPLERWPGLLAAAVARGVLTPRQVVLVAQTRMEGRPLAEVARALGRTYQAAQKDRRRAETALAVFASSYWSLESE